MKVRKLLPLVTFAFSLGLGQAHAQQIYLQPVATPPGQPQQYVIVQPMAQPTTAQPPMAIQPVAMQPVVQQAVLQPVMVQQPVYEQVSIPQQGCQSCQGSDSDGSASSRSSVFLKPIQGLIQNTHDLAKDHGVGCYSHHNADTWCSSLRADLRFIFSSCRVWWGEPCQRNPNTGEPNTSRPSCYTPGIPDARYYNGGAYGSAGSGASGSGTGGSCSSCR